MGDTTILWVTLLNLKGGGCKPPHLCQDWIHKMCFLTDGGFPNLLLNLSATEALLPPQVIFSWTYLQPKVFPNVQFCCYTDTCLPVLVSVVKETSIFLLLFFFFGDALFNVRLTPCLLQPLLLFPCPFPWVFQSFLSPWAVINCLISLVKPSIIRLEISIMDITDIR